MAPVVSALVGAGAIGAARAVVNAFTRGGLAGDVDWLLAPLWKLPPDARRRLRAYWTRAAFFEALGSQIGTISTSAAETLEASAGGYGDLPLVTISLSNPDAHRVRHQDALASRSTRGRHVVATNSGHWIPLDEPATVVTEIRRMVDLVGTLYVSFNVGGDEDARGAYGWSARTILPTATSPPQTASSPPQESCPGAVTTR